MKFIFIWIHSLSCSVSLFYTHSRFTACLGFVIVKMSFRIAAGMFILDEVTGYSGRLPHVTVGVLRDEKPDQYVNVMFT